MPVTATLLSVSLWGSGADGWGGWPWGSGAAGAYVTGSVSVTPLAGYVAIAPGEVLRVTVGGRALGEACGQVSSWPPNTNAATGGFSAVARYLGGVPTIIALAGGGGNSIFDHNHYQAGGRAIPLAGCGPQAVPIAEGQWSGAGWTDTTNEARPDGGAGLGGVSCAPGLYNVTSLAANGLAASGTSDPGYAPYLQAAVNYGLVVFSWAPCLAGTYYSASIGLPCKPCPANSTSGQGRLTLKLTTLPHSLVAGYLSLVIISSLGFSTVLLSAKLPENPTSGQGSARLILTNFPH